MTANQTDNLYVIMKSVFCLAARGTGVPVEHGIEAAPVSKKRVGLNRALACRPLLMGIVSLGSRIRIFERRHCGSQ